jgi:ferredoxin
MSILDRKIEDTELKRATASLTQDRIEQVINSVLQGETGARLKAYTETCMRCGMCAPACHYCVSHDMDPSYSPVGKVEQTMGLIFRKHGRLTPEEPPCTFRTRPTAIPPP